MPDVKMPDGTVIRNVPQGTSRATLEGMWKERKLQRQVSEHPIAGPLTSFMGGAADMMTFGAGDEIAATIDTLNPFHSGPTAYNSGFSKAWNANQRAHQGRDKELARTSPKANLAGSVAGAILPAIATGGATLPTQAPRAAGAIPRVVQTARQAAPAVAQSAAYGFNSGQGGIKERAAKVPEAVAWGLGGDLAGRAVGRTLGRVFGGQQVDDSVRLLADEGVTLTPGQRAGQGSFRNTFEDKFLGSIPFVSDVVAAARNRGANDLRVATANRVLAPIGGNVPRGTQINHQAIGNIQDTVYSNLDDAAGQLSLQVDDDLLQGFQNVAADSPRLVGTEGAQQVQANIDHLFDRLSQGPVSGDVLRNTLGELRGAASTAQGPMRDQLWALHDNLMDAVGRQNTSGLTQNFTNARESAALLKRMEDAATRPGVVDGEFNPTNLLQAATRRGYGTSTSGLAGGEGRLFDLANAAAGTMRNTTANSGTVPRALAGGVIGGGISGGAAMVDPTMGAITAGSLIGYVPGVDRALQNFALNRPDWLRVAGETANRAVPTLGIFGGATALNHYGTTP